MTKLKSKLFAWIESFSYVELVVLFLFLLFIVVPLPVPVSWGRSLAMFFDSSLGMVLLFFATLYFFLGTHPLLGVVFVFVAYEILRRSHSITQNIPVLRVDATASPVGHMTTGHTGHSTTGHTGEKTGPLLKEGDQPILNQRQRDARMASLNPPPASTLEEEVVALYGPTRVGGVFEAPTFDPITSSKIPGSVFT